MPGEGHRLTDAFFDDLTKVAHTIADNQSAGDLYRALVGRQWRKREARGSVTLSPIEAEEVVNRLREQAGQGPLDLSRPPAAGPVSETIELALASLGWRHDAPSVS